MENQTTSRVLALTVCKALSEKRGKDIVCLYVREKTDLCDYFVIASGSNAPQIRAMGERVEELVEAQLGLVPSRTEGVRDGRWGVVDYGDVIVHIFNDETRLFYHLERLWADGGNLQKYNDQTEDLEGGESEKQAKVVLSKTLKTEEE
ncbi:MAG: ribosome silencing factor [Clostridia bacterium]|nr:ribosome silencing factor [Clostridia bacterium]